MPSRGDFEPILDACGRGAFTILSAFAMFSPPETHERSVLFEPSGLPEDCSLATLMDGTSEMNMQEVSVFQDRRTHISRLCLTSEIPL